MTYEEKVKAVDDLFDLLKETTISDFKNRMVKLIELAEGVRQIEILHAIKTSNHKDTALNEVKRIFLLGH